MIQILTSLDASHFISELRHIITDDHIGLHAFKKGTFSRLTKMNLEGKATRMQVEHIMKHAAHETFWSDHTLRYGDVQDRANLVLQLGMAEISDQISVPEFWAQHDR